MVSYYETLDINLKKNKKGYNNNNFETPPSKIVNYIDKRLKMN